MFDGNSVYAVEPPEDPEMLNVLYIVYIHVYKCVLLTAGTLSYLLRCCNGALSEPQSQ